MTVKKSKRDDAKPDVKSDEIVSEIDEGICSEGRIFNTRLGTGASHARGLSIFQKFIFIHFTNLKHKTANDKIP